MSFLFGSPAPPPAPPPPPAAPQQASPSIMEQGAAEKRTLASAEGQGYNGTDVTGGQGAKNPVTTAAVGSGAAKSLLGG